MKQNQRTIIYKNFYDLTRDSEIRSQDTTWHVIAKNDDVEIIRGEFFDLDKAEINVKNGADLTPLAIAIERNNLEMVKELIKCGAKVSIENLEFLIEKNNPKMFKELINHGAHDSQKNTLNHIKSAIEKNNPKMVKELINHVVEIPQENMLTFVESAIEKNNPKIVKELIKSGDEIPKENMLNFIAIARKEEKYPAISQYLISVFNIKNNSEAVYQSVNSANSSREVSQSIPSCEPSPVKKGKLTDYKQRALS